MPRTSKSRPFSIRLSQTTNRFVEAEARRTKRSKGAVVEALTEEAARIRRFPGIGFRGEEPYREAWVIGTGLDVWELIAMLEDYDSSVDRLLKDHENVTSRAVELARAYHASYPEEIDEKIADNRRPLSELRELYPFAEFIRVDADE
jgi:uncharacterized protein (DUF433 family)